MLDNRKAPDSPLAPKRSYALLEALKRQALPALLKARADQGPLRLWVPACATGEHAYFLAITFVEYLNEGGDATPLKVFGTDVSASALATARLGIYSEDSIRPVGPSRMRRFFEKVDGGYRICAAVRDLCVFARHDVRVDPPLARLHLIDSRNVFAGWSSPPADALLLLFYFALHPGGVLLRANADEQAVRTDLFAVADAQHHVYRRTTETKRLPYSFLAAARSLGKLETNGAHVNGAISARAHDVQRQADRAVLAHYGPCGVVVDEALRIVEFRGQTGAYLEPAPGTPTLNVLQMAREGLLADLRACIDEARHDNKPARRERVKVSGRCGELDLQVMPITASPSGQRYLVILFEETPVDAVAASQGPEPLPSAQDPERDREIKSLRQELAATRAYLQSIIEQKETSNEELLAANEELQCSNEELQSANEELEAAQEEIEVANEGLRRLNVELEQRGNTAAKLGDDMANLIDCMQMPTVVVGNDSRLRRLSPSALRVLNLVATDIGRPLRDFKLNINVNLEHLFHEVIDTLSVKQLEIADKTGRWFQLVIRPYKTSGHKIDGAVLTLVDIDALKRRERQIKEAHEYAAQIVDSVRQPLVILGSDLRVRSANAAFYETFQTSPLRVENHPLYAVGGGQWDMAALHALLDDILPKEDKVDDFPVAYVFPALGRRLLLVSARKIAKRESEPNSHVLLTIEDAAERKRVFDTSAANQPVQHGSAT